MPTKPLDFENNISQLETIVEAMGKDDLSLEQALKHFESGIKLTHDCQKALQQAEQKVQILADPNGKENPEIFNNNNE